MLLNPITPHQFAAAHPIYTSAPVPSACCFSPLPASFSAFSAESASSSEKRSHPASVEAPKLYVVHANAHVCKHTNAWAGGMRERVIVIFLTWNIYRTNNCNHNKSPHDLAPGPSHTKLRHFTFFVTFSRKWRRFKERQPRKQTYTKNGSSKLFESGSSFIIAT